MCSASSGRFHIGPFPQITLVCACWIFKRKYWFEILTGVFCTLPLPNRWGPDYLQMWRPFPWILKDFQLILTSEIISSALHTLIFCLLSAPFLLNSTSVHFLDFSLVLDCFPSLSDTQSSSKSLVNSLNSSKKLPLFPAFHHLLILYLLSGVEFSPPPVRLCVINAVLPAPTSLPSHLPLALFPLPVWRHRLFCLRGKKSSSWFSCDSSNISQSSAWKVLQDCLGREGNFSIPVLSGR